MCPSPKTPKMPPGYTEAAKTVDGGKEQILSHKENGSPSAATPQRPATPRPGRVPQINSIRM